MTRYIEQLNENTAPVSGDFVWGYDASAPSDDKDRKISVLKFAILALANVFTTTQSITPATTGAGGLAINMPASTSSTALGINYNSIGRVTVIQQAGLSQLILNDVDLGANVVGAGLYLGRNSNVGSPAAGFVRYTIRDGNNRYSWPDASGNLRIGTTAPTYDNDATGTVVGTQTSSLDSKDVLGEFTDYDDALAAILATPVYDFKYKSGAFNGEKFTGIITDFSPIFGMDRDAAHPAGKSLNEVTGFGYTIAALKAMVRRLIEVERRVA